MASIKEQLDKNRIPQHIAIIMDGNGRWAARHGKVRTLGHEHGVEAVRAAVEGAAEIGVKNLTLYAFSTENWGRPAEEVNALMGLLIQAIENETEKLSRNNVRLSVIGNIGQLPDELRIKLFSCIDFLKSNTGLNLILALSYSAKWELVEATRNIATDVKSGKLSPDEITNEIFEGYLSTKGIPHPELLIRTSGEFRISNFLLWQIAYAELYFTETLWPDFSKENLFEAVADFQKRERRFGKTSDQLVS